MSDRALSAWKPTPRDRVLLLLVSISVLAGLGRDGILAATPEIRESLSLANSELDLSDRAYGFGFYLALGLGGVLAELLGTRLALLVCGAGTGAALCLTGSGWSLAVLTLSRLGLGFSVGALLPASAAALAAWTPPRERGWAVGACHAALAAGGALAAPVFALVLALVTWRAGFFVLAGSAAAWGLAWWRWFEADPGAGSDHPAAAAPLSWRGALPILALPTALAVALGWGLALCREWVPRVLLETWHFDIKLSSWIWAASSAATILGCLAGGIGADRSLHHSGNIRSAHQIVPALGFLLAGLSLALLPIGLDERAIALWLGLALFGLEAAGVMLWVYAIDVGGRHTGVSAGFVGLGLLLSQIVSPLALSGFGLDRSVAAPVVILALASAGVLSFRLRPHIELPMRPLPPSAPVPTEAGAGAAAEIDALLGKSGKKRRG
jgi:sugar phosphate permease